MFATASKSLINKSTTLIRSTINKNTTSNVTNALLNRCLSTEFKVSEKPPGYRVEEEGCHGAMGKPCMNFSAGPARLPDQVALHMQKNFLDYEGLGMSIYEINQRQTDNIFTQLQEENRLIWREILSAPDNYEILFVPAGAVGQFSSVPLNLFGGQKKTADYITKGFWSQKAADEAKKYGNVNEIQSFADYNPDSAYLYYCGNETIVGLEVKGDPPAGLSDKIPVVADMSSNLLQREIDVSRYGMFFVTGGKNFPLPGLVMCVIRNDLFDQEMSICPTILSYKKWGIQPPGQPNTIPPLNIHAINQFGLWMLQEGGLKTFAEGNRRKEDLVYGCVKEMPEFWQYMGDPEDDYERSGTNVCLKIVGGGSDEANKALEEKFFEECEALGMHQVRGHVSVGHIRISLYNIVPESWVEKLVDFMRDFAVKNSK